MKCKRAIPKGWKLLKPGTKIIYGDAFTSGRIKDWMRSRGQLNRMVPRSGFRYIRKIKPWKK